MAASQLRSPPMIFANIEKLQRELDQMSSSRSGNNPGEGNQPLAMNKNANTESAISGRGKAGK